MVLQVLQPLANTLGFFAIFKAFFSLCMWVWVTFFRPAKNLKEYGYWALVTGSTDGIGKAFAFELASKGIHLILVGRNPTKLIATASEIHERYGNQVMVKSIVIDFSYDSSEVIHARIEEIIDGLDVGILINNVGTCNQRPRFFHEADSEIFDIIKVNVEGITTVTRAVLPVMLKKKKGAIVNIGSGSSDILPSFPLFTVYAATKAYIHHFSKGLYVEYKQHGIDVQCQVPLLVDTKMLTMPLKSFFIPTPEVYSRSCLRWIGYEPLCMPYWKHSLEGNLALAMPKAIMDWQALRYILDMRVKIDRSEELQTKNLHKGL